MKLVVPLALCLIVCYIHLASSTTKDKNAHGNTANAKNKGKESTSDTKAKAKKNLNIRTPFDQVLEKLSNCAASSTDSPSIAEVMETNLKELQDDDQYTPLFNAAPHTAAFLKKKKKDSKKFIPGLRQALQADWSNPAWKSYKEIDTLFRPFKQQFVYTMMRFNCT